MDALNTYLNSLPTAEQGAFAKRCATSIGYLRKAISKGQQFGLPLCASLERESGGAVVCEQLRPDIAWRRVPDPEWPWHPDGKPLIDPLPAEAEQLAEEVSP